MKVNRLAPLLERLAGGCKGGVDICSPNGLDHALSSGFAPERTRFTGTGVSPDALDRLLQQPRLTINCDTIGMIRRIGERCPGREIGMRVRPGLGARTADAETLVYQGRPTTQTRIIRQVVKSGRVGKKGSVGGR